MDDFGDPFLSSTSWVDMNASGRSSWTGNIVSQTSSLLADPSDAYKREEKSPSLSMIASNYIMGNMPAAEANLNGHDTTSSAFLNGNLKYDITKVVCHTENQLRLQEEGLNLANLTVGSFGAGSNRSCPVMLPHSSLTTSGSIDCNAAPQTAFIQSLGDSNSLSSVPTLWPSSYSGLSPLMMGQAKLQGFGSQGVETDSDVLGSACMGDEKFPQLDNLSVSSLQDQNVLYPPGSHSFTSRKQIELAKADVLQPHQQLIGGNNIKHFANISSATQSYSSLANAGACNGVAKPRVRARRGQATDPHSIAERLRREKIAERMKNLQELVPNSNKTDKASMLDEIIDYVKFLQLQVKVLSMSRLGAAGAVVPLITDVQAEGCGNLLSSRQGAMHASESEDSLAFEQEVVKLMELNVTSAMQYLQNKGLCLMPIALASAISSQKGSSSSIPPESRKPGIPNVRSPQNGLPMERHGRDTSPNGCNGVIVKQEGSPNSFGSMGT